MVGNKIADGKTSVSKKSAKKLPTIDEDAELITPEKDTYHQKKDNKLLTNWG